MADGHCWRCRSCCHAQPRTQRRSLLETPAPRTRTDRCSQQIEGRSTRVTRQATRRLRHLYFWEIASRVSPDWSDPTCPLLHGVRSDRAASTRIPTLVRRQCGRSLGWRSSLLAINCKWVSPTGGYCSVSSSRRTLPARSKRRRHHHRLGHRSTQPALTRPTNTQVAECLATRSVRQSGIEPNALIAG
jgi:hypothetical protein